MEKTKATATAAAGKEGTGKGIGAAKTSADNRRATFSGIEKLAIVRDAQLAQNLRLPGILLRRSRG